MSEQDYEEILDQNVEDVKKSIKELEDPDYRQILELEEEGDDRKTVKQFLESKIDDTEDEETGGQEGVEEETEEPFLTGFSRRQVLTGGLLFGVIVGLIAGFGFTAADAPDATPQQIETSVSQLFEASGQDANIQEITERNGMYYTAVEMDVQGENGTETQVQNFYVSPDGELLFPEVQNMMMQSPINIQETMAQLEQMEENPPQEAPEAELEEAPEDLEELE